MIINVKQVPNTLCSISECPSDVQSTDVSLTLPAVVAHTQLLSGQVAVAVVGAATVVLAVGDVAGLTLPVLVAFTVNAAGDGAAGRAFAVARTVVWAGIYSAVEKDEQSFYRMYDPPPMYPTFSYPIP